MEQNHIGLDGFVWAIGVVEDRDDPLRLGRCKVRWIGFHTKEKEKIKTKDLPWTRPIAQLDPGRNYVGPKERDWVFGFFADGRMGQEPFMVGLLGGYPEEIANPKEGFNDPRPDDILEGHQVPRRPDKLEQHDDGSGNDIEEIDKKERYPEKRDLKEPDTARYARGYDGGDGHIEKTVVPEKLSNIDIGQRDVPTAEHTAGTGSDVGSGGSDWSEPETAFAAEYPYNHVYHSESDHLIEIDDTPGSERMHWYHRVGTFKEWSPVGGEVSKIVDKKFEIVLEQRFTHIEAADFLTVDWGKKTFVNKDREAGFNYDIFIGDKGNFNLETEGGKVNIHVRGDDMNIKVEKIQNTEVDEDKNTTVHKNFNIKVDQDYNIEVDGNTNITVHGDVNIQVDGDMTSTVNGNITATTLQNMSAFVTQNMNATVLQSLNANIAQDANINVDQNAYINVEGDTRETIKGDYYKIVDGDKYEWIKGDYVQQVFGDHKTFGYSDIFFEAKGNMFITSEDTLQLIAVTEIDEFAPILTRTGVTVISDTAPIINHDAATTNHSAIVTGFFNGTQSGSGAGTPVPGGVVAVPLDAPDATINYDTITTTITQPFIDAVPTPETAHQVDIISPLNIANDSTDTTSDAANITSNNPSNDGAAADGSNDAAAEASSPGSTSGGAGGAGGGGAGGPKAPSGPPIGAPAGFLWKPVSESTGNLVVLLPPGQSGPVTITEPSGRVSNGSFAGNANGGRDHFRFGRPGGAFEANCVITFPGYSLTVPDGSLRYEQ